MALCGGLFIGLTYLGIEVESATTQVLQKADLQLSVLVRQYFPSVGAASEEELVSEGSAGHHQASQDAPEAALAGTVDGALGAETPQGGFFYAAVESREELTEPEQIIATRACWKALDQAVRRESTSRRRSANNEAGAPLYDYLVHRQQAHQQVVTAIQQLDPFGVDPNLVHHLDKVLAWHQAGAAIFEHALQLLASAPDGQLSGPFVEEWQGQVMQHRMEEKLILNKHAAMHKYLVHALPPQ
jgi:hypothetical protein